MTASATTSSGRSRRRAVAARVATECGVWALVILTSLVPDSYQAGQVAALDDIDLGSLAAGFLMTLVLLGRRRRPLTVFAAVLAISLATALAGHQSTGGIIAVGVAVHQVARIGERVAAAVCACVGALALAVVLVVRYQQPLVPAFSVLTIIGLSAALGDAVHSRRTSRAERFRQAAEAREQELQQRVITERIGIARELHDAAAHQIAVINLQAGAGTAALTADRTDDAARALTSIQHAASDVLSEIAALLVVLRGDGGDAAQSTLPVRGLGDLPALLRSFEASSGLRVTGSHDTAAVSAQGAVDVVAYKAVQEALTNAQKHGVDGVARLDIVADGRELRIVVRNAVSDDQDRLIVSGGHGLAGMRERVSSVHGTIQIRAGADEFALDIRLPLTPETTA